MDETNTLETQAATSDRPIKVEVVNSEDLQTYLIKMAIAAGIAIVVKKGGEILIDELNERRKARKQRRAERKLQVVKDQT